jgi:hypothetical protein
VAPILPFEVPSDAKIWRFLRAYQYDPELAAQRLRRQVPNDRMAHSIIEGCIQ